MNILITGATGFLGSRIIEHIIDLKEIKHITATGRKFSVDNKLINTKVDYILGDLENVNFVKSLFKKDIDVVINCASLSSPWGSKKSFYNSNLLTQKNLLNESLNASIRRFIYISTPSIYFNFKDSINIHENSPLPKKMINNYAKTKWNAECLLRESKIPYVILRPRALIGRGDTVIMPRLIRSCLENKLKIMGNGKNIVDLTSVSNMAEAVSLSIFTENFNESYNISNDDPVNLWESINAILEAINIPKIKKKIPYSILFFAAQLMEFKARLSPGKEPVLTKYSVGVLAKSFTFDIEKAKTKLNYYPKQTTSESIEEFVQWYKKKNNDKSEV